MSNSRSFSSLGPSHPHLVRSTGGISGEVLDLRQDVEVGFVAMEGEVAGPGQSQANIRLNVQPTAADTISIGTDVYEFKAALTDPPTTPGNILVLRGASAAAALANAIAAINGSGYGTGVSSANGTKNVLASVYNTDYLHLDAADRPGGVAQEGTGPDVALLSNLTSLAVWDHTNLSKTGWSGGLRTVLTRVVVDASNLANDFDLKFPFTPKMVSCPLVTDATGVPDATGKAASILFTMVPARNAVTVDLNGGATDPVATDIVYIEVSGW